MYMIWIYSTFLFRFFFKLCLISWIQIIINPIDQIQRNYFRKNWIPCKQGSKIILSWIEPIWNFLFPFDLLEANQYFSKDHFISIDGIEHTTYQPEYSVQPKERGTTPNSERKNSYSVEKVPAIPLKKSNDANMNNNNKFINTNNFTEPNQRTYSQDNSNSPNTQHSIPPREKVFKKFASHKKICREINEAVKLSIEAKRTHVLIQKLYYISIFLMATTGIALIRIDFTRKFITSENSVIDPSIGFESVYAILLVLTVAFRNDYPFNLSILLMVTFYTGCVLGLILLHSLFLPSIKHK